MNINREIQIGMVSNHVQSVLGDEPLSPAKATAMGACKVIPQEYPAFRCRSIDILLEEGKDRPAEWLADRLIAELTIEPFSSAVAYRKGLRWAQDFEPLRSAEAHVTVLREGGVYLITGGLGNIGLTLAEHLANTVRAKLVLLGRSAFPERQEWDQWLATHGDDEVTRDHSSQLVAAAYRPVKKLDRDDGANTHHCGGSKGDSDQLKPVRLERFLREGGGFDYLQALRLLI